MERLGYGRERDYGDEGDYGHGDNEQFHGQQDGHGEEYQDWHEDDFDNNDFDDEDLDGDDAEDFTGLAEYLDHYAADTEAQTDGLAARFGWRFRARGGRRGKKWLPPSTRDHYTPVFVRVKDLQKRGDDSPTDLPPGPAGETGPA